MESLNKFVPEKVINSYKEAEIIRLKAQIAELEDKLQRKENAISEFKKWQRKVVEYKWEYWLQMAKDMEIPPKELHEAVKTLFIRKREYTKAIQKLDKKYREMERCKEEILKD